MEPVSAVLIGYVVLRVIDPKGADAAINWIKGTPAKKVSSRGASFQDLQEEKKRLAQIEQDERAAVTQQEEIKRQKDTEFRKFMDSL